MIFEVHSKADANPCYDIHMNTQKELPDVLIYETEYVDGHRIRVYENEDGWHSATYLEPDLRTELIFEYMKKFNLMFALPLDIYDVLMIGGGGYSYPKYILSHYEDISMDVVEIDPNAEKSARQFFYLDEVLAKYDPEEKRLHTFIDDGRHYIANTDKKYDVIINDAYTGVMPEVSLYTLEAAKLIKTKLKEDGVLVANLPGFYRFEGSRFLQNTLATFAQVFEHILLVRADNPLYESHTCNYVMFASDCYDEIPGRMAYKLRDPVIMHDQQKKNIEENYEF